LMHVNSESVSNEIDESDLHLEKHLEQKSWTWWGTVTDLKEEQWQNAFDLMRVNSESVSNEIDESELQNAKHSKQKNWTRRGIVIDLREQQEQNPFDSMRINDLRALPRLFEKRAHNFLNPCPEGINFSMISRLLFLSPRCALPWMTRRLTHRAPWV
jgi:hypothetical protein